MRIYHILFLAICSLALNYQSQGQKKIGENAVQITGACLVSDSLYPAPYVSIFETEIIAERIPIAMDILPYPL
jgi:hypothetical protein